MDVNSLAVCATFDMLVSMISELNVKLDQLTLQCKEQAEQAVASQACIDSMALDVVAMRNSAGWHAGMVEDSLMDRMETLDLDLGARMDKLAGTVTVLSASFGARLHGMNRKTK